MKVLINSTKIKTTAIKVISSLYVIIKNKNNNF